MAYVRRQTNEGLTFKLLYNCLPPRYRTVTTFKKKSKLSFRHRLFRIEILPLHCSYWLPII